MPMLTKNNKITTMTPNNNKVKLALVQVRRAVRNKKTTNMEVSSSNEPMVLTVEEHKNMLSSGLALQTQETQDTWAHTMLKTDQKKIKCLDTSD